MLELFWLLPYPVKLGQLQVLLQQEKKLFPKKRLDEWFFNIQFEVRQGCPLSHYFHPICGNSSQSNHEKSEH